MLPGMEKTEATQRVLAAKKNKRLTWAELAQRVGLSEIFVASCGYGENSLPVEYAQKLCEVLDLDEGVRDALTEFPTKGNSLEGKLVPTDPLLYRFYEILCVYGTSLKDSIQEKCGDGIMSHRLHPRSQERAGPQGRPRRRGHERQVLALPQVLSKRAAFQAPR